MIDNNMKNQCTISSAYEWKKDGEKINNSEKAIKQIYKIIKSRFSDNEKILITILIIESYGHQQVEQCYKE
jgi:hypothetical protein